MTALLLVTALLAPSKVVKVVVYPDRAQVTRQQSVACGAQQVVAFPGVPPSADPASFRAQVEGGTLDGLRAEEKPQAEPFGPEVQALDTEIEKIDAALRLLDDAREREAAAVQLAEQYLQVTQQAIGRELTEPSPNLKAWNAAFEQALTARLKAAAEAEASAGKRRALVRDRDQLTRKRARLTASTARLTWLAEAIVSCPAAQAPRTAKVSLSYMVGGASWSPSYAARERGGNVELTTYATVRQSTGEDWNEAQVVLSTALPRDRATPPEITPLKVWADEQRPPRKVIVSREEYTKHAETGGEGQTRNDGARLRVAAQGLSVQLAVPEPADVPGDGTPARLDVGKVTLKGRLELRSVPKMAPFVFRVAELTNAAPYPLLPGPIDLFRKGDFMARHELERIAQGERMRLTFGLEENVKVKRTVLEELKRDQGVLGPSRRRKFGYRFEVANYLSRADEVEISEHVPVSELDDVHVALDTKATTAGYQLRDQDGIITWHVKLKPGEKRTLDLHYAIDVPAAYDAGGT